MARYLLIPKEDAITRGVIDVSIPPTFLQYHKIATQYSGLAKFDPLFVKLHDDVGKLSRRKPVKIIRSPIVQSSRNRERINYPINNSKSKDSITIETLEFPGVSIVDLPDDASAELIDKTSSDFHALDLKSLLSIFLPFVHQEKLTLTDEDSWHLEKINLHAARENNTLGTGKGVRVAILDTGVNSGHLEITGQIIKSYDRFGNLLKNGDDVFGHGTMVASLICGKRLGAAPDAKIIDIAIMTRANASAELEDFFMGLATVGVKEKAAIVNISGGLHNDFDVEQFRAFLDLFPQYIYVVASGNDGANNVLCPGSIEEVVTVGATDKKDRVWHNSGGKRIQLAAHNESYYVPDLVAPGVDITVAEKSGKYKVADGTSLATPIVAGVLACLIENFESKYNHYNKKDVIDALYDRCRDLGERPDRQGRGLLML